MGQFVGCLEGMGEACRALDFPIVSGNVSLYNESKATGGGSAILPTPAIGGVGLLADWSKSATIAFKGTGDVILRDRHAPRRPRPVAVAARSATGARTGRRRASISIAERRDRRLRPRGDRRRALTAVHDVSDGGIAVALAEMALAGGIGAMIDRKQPFDCAASLLRRGSGRVRRHRRRSRAARLPHAAHAAGVEVEPLGRTGGKRLIFERPDRDDVVTLDALRPRTKASSRR